MGNYMLFFPSRESLVNIWKIADLKTVKYCGIYNPLAV